MRVIPMRKNLNPMPKNLVKEKNFQRSKRINENLSQKLKKFRNPKNKLKSSKKRIQKTRKKSLKSKLLLKK
jgi:hypothetical protein